MSFDSVTFWLFFVFALACWWLLPFRISKITAVFFSLFFYAWWNVWYLPLIIFSSAVDFLAGSQIARHEKRIARRFWLGLSLVTNLGLLASFKYGGFLDANFRLLLERFFSIETGPFFTQGVIPIGISFYTFQTLSYSLDIYFRRLKPTAKFSDFLLYVSFFPQLVAGPIVRARELLPQFRRRMRPSVRRVELGLYRIIWGLFMKIVVADTLAPTVDRMFDSEVLATARPLEVWQAYFFSIQIFADFAGYSGIAIGLGNLLGLRFPVNFRYPYISRGFSEFWTRWHITLSQWLRDYLYIPLGGNRDGKYKTCRNLIIVMLLGGLWHGAAWTYVVWGGIHGAALVAERLLRDRNARIESKRSGYFSVVGSIIGVNFVVLISWVFFRAPTFEMAAQCLERMFLTPWSLDDFSFVAHGMIVALVVVLMHVGQFHFERYQIKPSANLRAVWAGIMLFVLFTFERTENVPFVYFQF